MVWFWSFLWYSALGWCLEVAYSELTRGERGRKCLLVLPLCPVYGLGALAVLAAAPLAGGRPWGVFLLGGAAATAVEFLVGWFYEHWLGVRFWDYSGLWGNVRGLVCLPFALAWGVLAVGLTALHPLVTPWFEQLPWPVTLCAVTLVVTDGLVSALMLRRTGVKTCLAWWRRGEGGV